VPRRELCSRLFAYAWPHRNRIGAHLGLSVLIALLELLTPWPMKIVVDSVLGSHPLPPALASLLPASVSLSKVPLLVVAVAAGLGLKALAGALTILETYLNIGVRQRILLALKSALFQHLQRLSFTFHDNRRLGDSIYRVNNDAHCVEDFVASTLHLLTASCTLVGMLWIVFRIDWPLALLSAAVAPFLYWSIDFYFKRFNPRIHRVQQMEAESTSIVQETLSNLRVVKAFAREDYEHDRFVEQGDSTVHARIKLTVQQSLFAVTVGVTTAAGTALVLGVGALHVLHGSLTVGELLVVLAYLASIYGPLEAISGTLSSVQTDLAKAERVFEVLDTDADVKDVPGAVPLSTVAGRVTFRDVGFGYRQGVEILQGIDFDVEPGQTVGIVGPTGAGKTSLVSLIPRFYDVSAGRVTIDGTDVRTIQLTSLRQQVALVLQESILFSGTIAENIGYGRMGASPDEIVEAAKAANAHRFIMALPDQYRTQVGERGVMLSGGERQRISIARAFLKGARILILDEPTSAVDTRTEAVILEALERLMRGRTTFIIAHRLSTLRRADQILVLQHGQIVERGRHADLLRSGNLYAALSHAQA
jgi:ABC-type multidrug transport system fused ATPase/permease subunit